HAQWQERVRWAMSNLPQDQLAVVKLAFFDDLSHRRIAAETGLPVGTVKGRIRLALARLRRGLEAPPRSRISAPQTRHRTMLLSKLRRASRIRACFRKDRGS